MNKKTFFWVFIVVLGIFLILTSGVFAEEPKELKIVFFNQSPLEEPWNTAMVQSIERVMADPPHGLKITYKYAENILTPDAERVMREYATIGAFDIIWANGVYTDAAAAISKGFPETMVVGTGSGFAPAEGTNFFWGQTYTHEPAYLLGVIAGLMTKTNIVGVVAGYPYPNVNGPVNGFISGVKSVNPDAKVKVTYIESWYDPAKAKESAIAQYATGADYIFAERLGVFEAANEVGKFAFGNYVDQNSLAPKAVVSSAIMMWDEVIRQVIDDWYEAKVNGKPFSSPGTEISFLMASGAGDIAPYHDFAETLPKDVIDKVAEIRQQILDGEIVVPLIPEMAKTD